MKNYDKVAIIGSSRSNEDAPYENKEWTIWAMNEMELERYDEMWELHPLNTEVQNEREIEILRNCEKRVFVLDAKEAEEIGIKHFREYPLNEILQESWSMDYFTCTMAYQIAYAIYVGYQVIGLWGLNMDIGSPRERTVESACIQAWLGIAKGRGIEVIWNEHPCKRRLRYGYDYWDEITTIDNWLYKLAVHINFRLGYKHICVGESNERKHRKHAINKKGNTCIKTY